MDSGNALYVANKSKALQSRVDQLIEEVGLFLQAAGIRRVRSERFCYCHRRGKHSFCYKKRWRWRTVLEQEQQGSFTYADGDFALLWVGAETAVRSAIESAGIELEVLDELL